MHDHFAGVFDEICKQPVFDRRKVDFRLFQEYAAFSKIDAQGVLDEDRLCLTLLHNLMTQRNADPCQQLSCTERLCEIVVGPCIERSNFILFLFPR